jgi:hypothetical protein
VTIFYCLIWDCPNLEGEVPIFIAPRNRLAQLYPLALGSLFVASYVSQGYGGGILTRLHTETLQSWVELSLSYGRWSPDQFVLVSGSPLGPMTRFYPYPFFSDNCFVVFLVGRPLWWEDGSVTYSAIADWSGNWGPLTIHYHLIWDWVPSSSPLTTLRDYGGGILTRLHTVALQLLSGSPYISSRWIIVVCIIIDMETCFNKLLHSNGHLCDAFLTPLFWFLGVMSQYFMSFRVHGIILRQV